MIGTRRFHFGYLAILAILLAVANPVFARDAAFLDPSVSSPGGSGGNTSSDAVTVEPKGDIDTGESTVNIARRIALFFVNQTGLPVEVLGVTVNGDGNVAASIVSDDCSKEGKIAPTNRCSVIASITPTSNGPWSAEVMLTHKSAGRIARSKISGKATGSSSASDRRDAGLSLSSKEIPPINFGDVEAGGGQAVRSALMVNDSPEPITLLSIDLIAAENGLARLDQGCSVDMDLKPGESCPITLAWKPATKGAVSTDMIVRHSGKLGFAVIPVRGTSKEGTGGSSGSSGTSVAAVTGQQTGGMRVTNGKGKTPLPPTADELEKIAAGKIPQVSADSVGADGTTQRATPVLSSVSFRLIGTVGNRAVLLKPDGTTSIVGVNEEISTGDDTKPAKLLNVTPRSAILFIDGKKKELPLESAEELTSKGVIHHHAGSSTSSSAAVSTSK